MPETEQFEDEVPRTSWNYRVIQFVGTEGELRRSIHEVYYVGGVPSGFIERPADVAWEVYEVDEGDAAALLILERMREAVSKPVLTQNDFRGRDSCVVDEAGAERWKGEAGRGLSLLDALSQRENGDFDFVPPRLDGSLRKPDDS
ncbi:hypothetical protein [Caballeronia sp. KNU42]